MIRELLNIGPGRDPSRPSNVPQLEHKGADRWLWRPMFFLVGLLSYIGGLVASGGSQAYGAGAAVAGVGIWRLFRYVTRMRRQETDEWLQAYVDGIDAPRESGQSKTL